MYPRNLFNVLFQKPKMPSYRYKTKRALHMIQVDGLFENPRKKVNSSWIFSNRGGFPPRNCSVDCELKSRDLILR